MINGESTPKALRASSPSAVLCFGSYCLQRLVAVHNFKIKEKPPRVLVAVRSSGAASAKVVIGNLLCFTKQQDALAQLRFLGNTQKTCTLVPLSCNLTASAISLRSPPTTACISVYAWKT
jgi:hypothetical protein